MLLTGLSGPLCAKFCLVLTLLDLVTAEVLGVKHRYVHRSIFHDDEADDLIVCVCAFNALTLLGGKLGILSPVKTYVHLSFRALMLCTFFVSRKTSCL